MRKRFNITKQIGSKLVLLLTGLILFVACGDSRCISGEGNVVTRDLELPPFSKIEANGDFKVYLLQGAMQKVEVRGQSNILDQLRTRVTDNTWKITHEECVRNSKGVEVFITLPVVEAVFVNGSGFIEGNNVFTTSDLEVVLNGSGRIELNVVAAKITSRITGSGKIHLQGSAPLHSIDISGSGRAETYNLASESVGVSISGSGIAQVAAAKTLDVAISGSGIVYYKGEPSVTQRISGSGKVVKE